jgi:hypothetical protein
MYGESCSITVPEMTDVVVFSAANVEIDVEVCLKDPAEDVIVSVSDKPLMTDEVELALKKDVITVN